MKKEIYFPPETEGVTVDNLRPIAVSLQGSSVEDYDYIIIDSE